MSTTPQHLQGSPPVERRFYSRVVPLSPIFVALDQNNQGVLLNVSENGLLVSTPTELSCNFVAHVAIPLNGLPKPVEVNVRVVWASETRKLAGIQLLDLSDYDREQIRKWGVQESSQSLPREPQRKPNPLPFVAATSATPSGSTRPKSAFTRLATKPQAIAPAASLSAIRTRPTPTAASMLKWGALFAALLLGVVFIVKRGALGSSFARSTENRGPSSAPTPPNQGTRGGLQKSDAANRGFVRQIVPPAPAADVSKSKGAFSALHNSVQALDDITDVDDVDTPAPDTQQKQRENLRNILTPSKPTAQSNPTSSSSGLKANKQSDARSDQSLSALTSIPPATETVPEKSNAAVSSSAANHTTPETSPVLSGQSATAPFRNSTHSNDAANVAPATPVSARKSDVIQMDAPERQVVQIPSDYRNSFFDLPSDQTLQSSSATMHIQRFVRVPKTHMSWPFRRNKKVIVGELISRADPQVPQIQPTGSNFVRVQVTVAEDGSIASVRPMYGSVILVPPVVKAIHEWRYQPTLIDGKPVQTQCDVVVQFHAPVAGNARP